jgi:hypothetical protein
MYCFMRAWAVMTECRVRGGDLVGSAMFRGLEEGSRTKVYGRWNWCCGRGELE